MALQNYQYDIIMREYNRRQSDVRHDLESRRREAYIHIPRLPQIDQEVASLSASKARSLLCGEAANIDDLRTEIQNLSNERIQLLKDNGYPEDYLEPHYYCPECQDTGYIDGHKCSCFKKYEIELLYTQSNLKDVLKKENFEHFSFDVYSDTITNEATGLTARETAQKAYDFAVNFVKNFDKRTQNLFLYGDTGVGKTFLSHCIANELIKTSHCVLYFSAFDLFDHLAKSAFSKKGDPDIEENFILDCDLLIIDDLGTELTNSFVSSQLFLCINERISRSKSTIISTNLKIEDFSATYSERTFSRIASNYHIMKLIGKDIRIQKIFLGGK